MEQLGVDAAQESLRTRQDGQDRKERGEGRRRSWRRDLAKSRHGEAGRVTANHVVPVRSAGHSPLQSNRVQLTKSHSRAGKGDEEGAPDTQRGLFPPARLEWERGTD